MGLWDSFGSNFNNTINTLGAAELNDQKIQEAAYKMARQKEFDTQQAKLATMMPEFFYKKDEQGQYLRPDRAALTNSLLQQGFRPDVIAATVDPFYKTSTEDFRAGKIAAYSPNVPKPELDANGQMVDPKKGIYQIGLGADIASGIMPSDKTIEGSNAKWEKTSHGAETKFTDVNSANPAANTQTVKFTPELKATPNLGGQTVKLDEYGTQIGAPMKNSPSPSAVLNNTTKITLAQQKLSPGDYNTYIRALREREKALTNDPNSDVSAWDTLINTLEQKIYTNAGATSGGKPPSTGLPNIDNDVTNAVKKMAGLKSANEKKQWWNNNQGWISSNLRSQIDPTTGEPYSGEKVQQVLDRMMRIIGI